MARIAYICGVCGIFNRGRGPCAGCEETPTFARAPYEGVQIGAIDGETQGFYPKEAGPLNGDKRHPRRVVKNKAAWREACKRNNWTDLS